MTDQPTTWTPERALECLRDWASDECDWPKWRREYEDGIDHGEIAQDLLRRCGAMVAEALESAAAEIAKLRNDAEVIAGFRLGEARLLDEVRKEAEQLRDWLAKEKARADALRKALIQCGRNVGGGIDDAVSDDFLMHVPEEARLVVERLRAELAAKQPAEAAQQGPSDEEIDSAIDSVRRHRLNSEDAFIETYHALRKIARRAGVKL